MISIQMFGMDWNICLFVFCWFFVFFLYVQYLNNLDDHRDIQVVDGWLKENLADRIMQLRAADICFFLIGRPDC